MSSITDRFEYRAPSDGQVQDISLIRAEKVLAGLLEKTPMEPRTGGADTEPTCAR